MGLTKTGLFVVLSASADFRIPLHQSSKRRANTAYGDVFIREQINLPFPLEASINSNFAKTLLSPVSQQGTCLCYKGSIERSSYFVLVPIKARGDLDTFTTTEQAKLSLQCTLVKPN